MKFAAYFPDLKLASSGQLSPCSRATMLSCRSAARSLDRVDRQLDELIDQHSRGVSLPEISKSCLFR